MHKKCKWTQGLESSSQAEIQILAEQSQSSCSSIVFLFPCLSLGQRGSLLVYAGGNWHKSGLDQHGDRLLCLLLLAATCSGIIMLDDGQGQFNRMGLHLGENKALSMDPMAH